MSVYEWPGNVRQLFNALVHASIHCTDKVIDIKDLPNELVSKNVIPDSPSPVTAHGRSLSDYMESQEANYLLSVYRRIMGTSPRQHRSWASPALLCMENSSGTESGEVLLVVHEWRNV